MNARPSDPAATELALVCIACGQLAAIPAAQLQDYHRGIAFVLRTFVLPAFIAWIAIAGF